MFDLTLVVLIMTSLVPNLRMCELDKNWKQHLLDCFYLSILGIIMGYYFCSSCYQDLYEFLVVYTISAGLWISQWKGHSLIHELLDRRYPWFVRTGTRVLLTIGQLFFYTIISITILHGFVQYIMGVHTGYFTKEGFIEMNAWAILIGTFITLVSLSSQFLQSWRQAEINAEKLKAAHISSQFETLKNQVNPHFLFNSLNVLTNLVYENQDTAAKFIKQLSQVYRYVLESRNKSLISIEEELVFVESYVFLQQIRFGENLKMSIAVDENLKNYFVPPLSMQMLLENAIKHNIVSEKDPLLIEMYTEDDVWLVVKNTLQKKNVISEEASGIGLANITKRYKYLCDLMVDVTENQNTFTVKIPIIKTAKS